MEQTSNKQYKKFHIQSIFDLSPPQRVFGLPRALLFRLGLLASFSSTSSSVRVTQSTPFPTGPPRFFFFHLVECSGYPEHFFSTGPPRFFFFHLVECSGYPEHFFSPGPPRFFFFHLVECSGYPEHFFSTGPPRF